jgi:hypothetical protein
MVQRRTEARASGCFMFSSARGGGIGQKFGSALSSTNGVLRLTLRAGYPYALLLSKANKNQVLAIIRRIKIFVLNEPLAAQAHRLDEVPHGVPKTCWRASWA